MRHASLLLALGLLTGCGGSSHDVCPSEKHRADPDGRGERCVDDRSSCDSVDDCASADPCCTASCEDASGGGVFECVQSCRQPECTEGACGDGWRCQEAPADACTAYCVPVDVQCADGFIPADPTGSGVFLCVPVDSSCLRPSDCPGSADGCCAGACREQVGGSWSCEEDCGAGESDRGAMWECTTDIDCEDMMGQPGWTCEQSLCGGNECVAPAPECDDDTDCALATDLSACCPDCPAAYSREELAANECLLIYSPPAGDSEGAPAPPEDPPVCETECAAEDCPLIQCAPADRAACSAGQCVPFYE